MKTSFNRFLRKISQGEIKYENPKKLDLKCIDKKIRKSIKLFNESTWCRTLWSCQGHIHDNNGSATLPYIVFVIDKKFENKFLSFIYLTLPIYKSKKFPVASSCELKISRGFEDKKYSIISIHWTESILYDIKLCNMFYKDLKYVAKKIKEFKNV